MTEKLYDLSFEIEGDAIDLEQDAGCGDVARITLHRCQLRLLAERAGLLPPTAHADADRTIARLSRQMRTLYERINELDDMIAEKAGLGQDLEAEQIFSMCTWEMSLEFVKDLPQPATPTANTPGSAHSNPPKSAPVDGQPSGDRVQRHRARRAAMLEALRARGLKPAWNLPAQSLQELFDRHCGARSATQPATAPATPATATLI